MALWEKRSTLDFSTEISTSELQLSSEKTSKSMWQPSQGSSKSGWNKKYKCLWEQQPKYTESKGWRNVFLSWTSGSRRFVHPCMMETICFLQGLLNIRCLWEGEGGCMPKACSQIYRAFSPFGKIKISLASFMQGCCPVQGKHPVHLQSSIFAVCARELAL